MSVDLQIDNGIPLQRPRPRTELDVLLDIADQLVRLTSEIQHLRSAIGTTSKSSVELTENAKGAVQITAKSYVDSPIDEACIDVVAAFRTLKQEVERGQMEQWSSTVEMLQGKGS